MSLLQFLRIKIIYLVIIVAQFWFFEARYPLCIPTNCLHSCSPEIYTGAPLWSGDWAVNYTYGSAEAVSALVEANCWNAQQAGPTIEWMISKQNQDGGWGESPESYAAGHFIQDRSSVAQSSAVINALIIYAQNTVPSPNLKKAIDKGVNYLTGTSKQLNYKISETPYFAVVFKGRTFGQYTNLPHYEAIRALGRYMEWSSSK